MLRWFLTFGLIVVQLSNKVESEEALYPDVSCHPTFKITPSGAEWGEGWILSGMKYCKTEHPPEECYKACIFQRHGILKNSFPTPETMHYMETESLMFRDTFGDDHVRSQIAEKIMSQCSEKLDEVNKNQLACEDREEFYNCVEAAWKC